jgi:diacylglycerol kinase family enzyme
VTVDLILNRNASRLGERSALRRVLLGAAARGGARVHETWSLEALDEVAAGLAAQGTDAVVLAGGDGSHMEGVSALARAFPGAMPAVAFAPGGTACTVARNFGLRDGARTWAERVVRAACDGSARVERKATLRVRDDAAGDRVGFIFGTGLVARFFDVYYESPEPGLAQAAGIAARVFAGSLVGSPLARRVLEPVPCTLEVDGVLQPARAWSLVLASVVRDVGLHILVNYRAGEELDRFHLVGSGLSPRALGMQFQRVLRGRPMRGEPRVDALVRSLRVSFEQQDAYVLDGDLMRARTVDVEPGPAISLLLP